MRLLQWQQPGKIGCTTHTQNIPSYAILSHTWGAETEEVTFDDLVTHQGEQKAGFKKIRFCGNQAEADGLRYFWVDTCCINKANHAELAESIASMFKWYEGASKCYVYLADVSAGNWEAELRSCRWFTRGWTLQELLAPRAVHFFAKGGEYLGDKTSLEVVIHEITGIPLRALRGTPLAEFDVEDRLTWTLRRQTTRPEDQAYCLQGLFNVFIPLIYGEGNHAWIRLRRAIAERLSHRGEVLLRSLPNARIKAADEDDDMIQQSLFFPEMQERRLNVEPRHQNTCEWIISVSEYQEWVSSSHGLLWIKGKPGAGKSTVMAFLYEEIARQMTVPIINLNFFFTARGTELQRTTMGLLRSLVNQLFFHSPDTRENIRARYREKAASYGQQQLAWAWQRSELESMFAENVVALSCNQPVIIFVDALDEAGEDSARKIAAYFHKLNDRATSKGAQLKICISCRHYPIVASRKHALEIVVEAHNNHDIVSFIQDSLYLDDMIEDDPGNEPGWVALKVELAQQAQGVFQWVRLVVPLVQKYVDDGESLEQVRLRLEEVPAELKFVYIYILETVINKEDRQLAFRFFQWVCLAIRPLTVTEMRYALAANGKDALGVQPFCMRTLHWIDTNERMKRRAKALSGGLIEISSRRIDDGQSIESIQVGHQSVNDFMLAEGLALLLSLSGYQPSLNTSNDELICSSQATLYWGCLDFLATDAVLRDHTSREIHPDILITYPLLDYSLNHMFLHAQKAMAHRSSTLSEEVSILLRIFPAWVKFHMNLLVDPVTGKTRPNKRQPVDEITQGYDRSGPDQPNWKTTLLHMVCQASLTDIVKHLLQQTSDVDITDEWDRTPLHLAAHRGHTNIAAYLHAAGADLNAVDFIRQTPLLYATSHTHLPLVKWLLEHDAKVNPTSAIQNRALSEAASRGHVELVKVLIDAGADINEGGTMWDTAIMVAIREGHDRVVEALINAGAELDRIGPSGSALCVAAHCGHKRMIEMLLRAKANIHAAGTNGTALCLASRNGDEAIVDLLIRHGVDVNHREKGIFPNALYAAAVGGFPVVVASLLRAGARVNANTRTGSLLSALGAAVINGHTSVACKLIAAGADVNTGSILAIAAKNGLEEVAKALIDAGADVNLAGHDGATPLFTALERGHKNIEQLLLSAGATVTDTYRSKTAELLQGCEDDIFYPDHVWELP